MLGPGATLSTEERNGSVLHAAVKQYVLEGVLRANASTVCF